MFTFQVKTSLRLAGILQTETESSEKGKGLQNNWNIISKNDWKKIDQVISLYSYKT